jgi:hypothetical protein
MTTCIGSECTKTFVHLDYEVFFSSDVVIFLRTSWRRVKKIFWWERGGCLNRNLDGWIIKIKFHRQEKLYEKVSVLGWESQAVIGVTRVSVGDVSEAKQWTSCPGRHVSGVDVCDVTLTCPVAQCGGKKSFWKGMEDVWERSEGRGMTRVLK